MKNIYIVFCLIVLSGCSASGPKFNGLVSDREGVANVYIYRPDSLTAGGRTAYFYMNEKPVAEISNNGYTLLEVAPGNHSFKQNFGYWLGDFGPISDDRIRTKELKAGNTYFLGLYSGNTISPHPVPSVHVVDVNFDFSFDFVKRNKSLRDIKECRFQQQEIN